MQTLQSRGLTLEQTAGWISVGPTLQSVSHPFVFAAGDCSHMESTKEDDDTVVAPPKAGVYAVRAGPILIHNLVEYLCNTQDSSVSTTTTASSPTITPLSSSSNLWEYNPQSDFLKLLMCGDRTALGFRFGIPLYGKWVWELKDHIDSLFVDLFDTTKFTKQSSVTNDHNDGGRTNTNESTNTNEKVLDTSQYDAAAAPRPAPLSPKDAAQYLQRTDEDVDFQRAWDVIKDMMEDEEYQQLVLTYIDWGKYEPADES